MGAEAGADYPKFWFMMPFVLFVFHIFFILPLVFMGTIYVEPRILHSQDLKGKQLETGLR